MIELELKRIADALEAIAIAIQPSALQPTAVGQPLTTGTENVPEAHTKKAKAKPEKPAPVSPEAEEGPTAAPAGEKVWTTDEIVEMVQKAVKINRNATLEVCKKYGYEKSLKEIDASKYPELAEALATVK